MKTRNKIIFGGIIVAPLFILGTVSAHGTAAEHANEKTQAQVAQASTDTKRQLTAEEKAALQERITKRKTDLKVRLSASEKQRLQTRCKNSNGQISSLSGRIKGIETSRAQVYQNLLDRLNKLNTKLKERGLDTTEFEAEIAQLETKIETFNTDLAAYKQAVIDLESLGADCATDAEGFKASLEAARTARAKVKADAQDIKTFVNDTIKPTLSAIRATIVKEDGEQSTEESTNAEPTTEGN